MPDQLMVLFVNQDGSLLPTNQIVPPQRGESWPRIWRVARLTLAVYGRVESGDTLPANQTTDYLMVGQAGPYVIYGEMR
jgi:hypothetical protein